MAFPPSRQQFLPPNAHLKLLSVDFDDDVFRARAVANSNSACCPSCRRSSTVVHSRYWRVLRDLPLQGRVVKLHIEVKRFRCDAATRSLIGSLVSCHGLRRRFGAIWLGRVSAEVSAGSGGAGNGSTERSDSSRSTASVMGLYRQSLQSDRSHKSYCELCRSA